jgi:magnesium-transporting ATPase (P-type)
VLPAPRPVRLWRRVAAQAGDPLVLLAAAVLTVATGDWADAGVIVLVIVVNTAVGVTQEVKAGQAIAALSGRPRRRGPWRGRGTPRWPPRRRRGCCGMGSSG